MTRAIVRASIVLSLLFPAFSGAWAEDPKPGSALDIYVNHGDTSLSRKDVDESARPLPPSGPITPPPYCNPAVPTCW
jgi:hypothetical protein